MKKALSYLSALALLMSMFLSISVMPVVAGDFSGDTWTDYQVRVVTDFSTANTFSPSFLASDHAGGEISSTGGYKNSAALHAYSDGGTGVFGYVKQRPFSYDWSSAAGSYEIADWRGALYLQAYVRCVSRDEKTRSSSDKPVATLAFDDLMNYNNSGSEPYDFTTGSAFYAQDNKGNGSWYNIGATLVSTTITTTAGSQESLKYYEVRFQNDFEGYIRVKLDANTLKTANSLGWGQRDGGTGFAYEMRQMDIVVGAFNSDVYVDNIAVVGDSLTAGYDAKWSAHRSYHNFSNTATTNATCTGTGSKTYACSTCGCTYKKTISALGHNYTAKVTAPTCTAQGYTTHTCSRCSTSYKDTYTAALGHNYAAATCTVAQKCTRCSTTTGSALGHSYTYNVTKNPTTSATGTLTGTCSRCGVTTTVTLPKLNTTDYTRTITKAATCTATGTYNYKWNTTTYGTFNFTDTIAATGHSYTSTVTAPTCTAQGYTTHTCSCGHSYQDNYTDATGHSYMSEVTTAATCTADGVRTYTCSSCSHSYTETIAALGHTPGAAATCTTAQTCTVCGTELAPATGHSYVQGNNCTVCQVQLSVVGNNCSTLDGTQCGSNSTLEVNKNVTFSGSALVWKTTDQDSMQVAVPGTGALFFFVSHPGEGASFSLSDAYWFVTADGATEYDSAEVSLGPDEKGWIIIPNFTGGDLSLHTSGSVTLYIDEIGYTSHIDAAKAYLAENMAAQEATHIMGASVNEAGTSLRFGFTLAGINNVEVDGYLRDITNATITLNGKEYKVVDFGAVISNKTGYALTLDDVNNRTIKVVAEKVFEYGDNYDNTGAPYVSFACGIKNIPSSQKNALIYGRSYLIFSDGVNEITIYGDVISSYVNDFA